nr:hypothetical protein [Tanacetum cinerariifolium]
QTEFKKYKDLNDRTVDYDKLERKLNETLGQKECKTIFAETSKTLRESNSVQDSCLVALQNKQTEFKKYKDLNDRTVDYDKLERKLNETLGQLAQKYIEIKEGLKTKAYEISVVKEKHNELIKQILLTKSHYDGLVKQKTKVITDLKLREEHDIDKMLSMEKQLKFLNEIVYKISQSIQTIHMMAPKVPTYNGRPTFANPRYLKQAQSEIPCFVIRKSDVVVVPDSEDTLMHAEESRSKMIEKQNAPQMIEKKVITKLIDYAALNQLSTDFNTRFVPQTESYTEQAFWSQYSVQTDEPNLSGTTIVEVQKELPKVIMVNSCLKKLKFHLASFDMVVKERTTATTITEGMCFQFLLINFFIRVCKPIILLSLK